MVDVVSGSLYRRTHSKSSGLVVGRRPLGAILHSSTEPGELSQWLCHDDSTINIVVIIIIIIIIGSTTVVVRTTATATRAVYCTDGDASKVM